MRSKVEDPKCSALNRCINAIRLGADITDIQRMLKSCGLTDDEQWLTYKGAMLICKGDDHAASPINDALTRD
jgi:hypothetical protein